MSNIRQVRFFSRLQSKSSFVGATRELETDHNLFSSQDNIGAIQYNMELAWPELQNILIFRRDTMSFTYVSAVIFILAVTTVQSILYRFLTEGTDVFKDCMERRNMLGFADIVDRSSFVVICEEDGLHADGNAVILWDVKQTDRISVRAELKKCCRGTWLQTLFTVKIADLCKDMRHTTFMTYEVWPKHIISEVVCAGKGKKENVIIIYVLLELSKARIETENGSISKKVKDSKSSSTINKLPLQVLLVAFGDLQICRQVRTD
uniref:Uncharacterized protein n=1 Tax=Glossina brevipalpis TaxID=37001 RepID=A0A1A9WR56_9MUSC